MSPCPRGAYIAGHVAAFFTNPIVLVILLAIVLALVGYVLWLVRRRKQIEAERRRRRRAQMEAEEARRRALAHETLRELTAILPAAAGAERMPQLHSPPGTPDGLFCMSGL